MRTSRPLLIVALVFLSTFLSNVCLSNIAAAQQSDQVIAEHVLGPQWKQLTRRAGMIFAGTVLASATETSKAAVTTQTAAAARPGPGPLPAVELRFRVDEAIAGVEAGQILAIHEWAGAWSMHRPMSKGQHILIFLYPPSRLGLTSPVGGSHGQVFLDSSGSKLSKGGQNPTAAIGLANVSSPSTRVTVDGGSVSVVQLERAIRSARSESEEE